MYTCKKASEVNLPKWQAICCDIFNAIIKILTMTSFYFIACLFPILFVLHEVEEIIYLPEWFSKHQNYLVAKSPSPLRKFIAELNFGRKRFAMAVFFEFVIICVVLLITILSHSPFLLSVLIMAFFIHLIAHIVQSIILQKRIPCLFSSLLLSPICLYCIVDLYSSYHLSENLIAIISCSLVSLFIVFTCLALYFNKKETSKPC